MILDFFFHLTVTVFSLTDKDEIPTVGNAAANAVIGKQTLCIIIIDNKIDVIFFILITSV